MTKSNHDPTPLILCRCKHCNGTGRVPLSDDMLATLMALRKCTATTTVVMAQKLKWRGSVTAMNQRLEDLRQLGFATRYRMGRRWMYQPV